MKLTKVYAVEVNHLEKIETGSSLGFFSRSVNYTLRDKWYTVSVFSTRKLAQRCIGRGEYPFSDTEYDGGTRIVEWEIDDDDITLVNGYKKVYGKWSLD